MKKRLDDLIKDDETVKMGKFMRYLLRYWWAIAVCAIIFAAMGYVINKIKSQKYEVTASIILNDFDNDGKGSLSGTGLGSLFSSFTMGSASYKLVEDEIRRVQSHGNLIEVIKQHNLNDLSWSKKGMFSRSVWYYNDAPIKIEAPATVIDTISTTTKFNIKVAPGGKDIRVVCEQPVGKVVLDQSYNKFPIKVRTPYATFNIDKSVTYNPTESLNFYDVITSPEIYAHELYKKVDLSAPSKKSNIIYLVMEDTRTDRARDILNSLVSTYNLKAIETNHEEARAAIDFIEDRMVHLYNQLQNSEKSIETFKKQNRITDPNFEAEYIFRKKGTAEEAMVEQRTKAGISQMVIDFLRNEGTKYSLVPFTSDAPEAPIQAYNELALERMRLEQNAKGNNASLKTINAQMDAMRINLINSLERDLGASRVAISDLERVNSESAARIGQVPTIERHLTELYRNRSIQNQIYGFLLQKREENQLKLARDIPSSRIMEEAYAASEPSGIGGKLLIVVFGFLGIAFGIVGLYLVYWYQNRRDKLAEVKSLTASIEENS